MKRGSAGAALRRNLARFRNRLAPRLDFVYSEDYEFHLPQSSYDGLRGERVLTALFHARRVRSDHVHEPAPVSIRALRRVHTDAYLERLSDPAVVGEIVGSEISHETLGRILEVQRSVVGGTLLATAHALYSGRTAVNLGGGLHHARADGGGGFCIFNDVAVAIERQRAEGFAGRVLVIDLDLHDGNGTREIFASDAEVFTFSIHNADWSDPTATASFSMTLEGEIDDDQYLEVIREHLPPVIDAFRPELVFYLAGVDPASDDRIGNWKISAAGMLERDLYVVDSLERASARRRRTPPLVILLAGGYGDQAWRYSARFLSALDDGNAVEPPTTAEVTLLHYRRLARDLGEDEESEALDDWGLTEDDLFGALGAGGQDRRLLGRFTRHEFEFLLERLGFIDRIREAGFLHPTIEFQPDGSGFILYADAEQREVLIELLMTRDRQTRVGYEFLRIEWLLMQNPRRRFTADRPRLPGQRHPGLGLLHDVLALLIVACETLELDGILFVPSHFHLAAQGRSVLHALEPTDEAFLEQLYDLLEGMPLDRALAALDEGRIRERGTGEVIRWRPMAMVLPTSRRLRDELDGDAYRTATREDQKRLQWELSEPASSISGSSPTHSALDLGTGEEALD